MERLKLPKGLTVFSGMQEGGKTIFCLKWANYLAKTQKVLFLSWSEYSDKKIARLNVQGEDKHSQLILEDSYEFFDANSFIEIFDRIDEEGFDVVFFDDLHYTDYNLAKDNDFADGSAIANSLLFIAKRLKVKVVLVTEVSIYFCNMPSEMKPILSEFAYPPAIVNTSNQIYYLNRPEPDIIDSKFDIYSLKNDTNKEFVMSFNSDEFFGDDLVYKKNR